MFSIVMVSACAILDIVLCIFFLQTTLTHRKNIPLPIYAGGFIVVEIIGLIPSRYFSAVYSTEKVLVLYATTFVSTLLLTYYYDASFRHRLFASIAFLVYGDIAELSSGTLLTIYSQRYLHLNVEQLDILIEFMSKFLIFLLIAITNIFWNRRNKRYSLKYNIAILLTPVISSIILLNTPFPQTMNTAQTVSHFITIIGLFLINLINYMLLDSLFQIQELRENEHLLQQQILFQENKYSQISTTYRSTRKILHDTKKHFFYIQECAEKGNCKHILEYLKKAAFDLENCYSRINTGNLVIDAFVSSHLTMAEQEHILYETNIQVSPKRIPVDDYELCILLGNLLDNSIQECRNIIPPRPRSIEVELFTSETEFVIHISNSARSIQNESDKNSPEYRLYHGYGIQNVKSITERYNGTYAFSEENNTYEAIIVIPIMH